MSQCFTCYKNLDPDQKTKLVFICVIKPNQFLQGTKIESTVAKELQKPNQLLCLIFATESIFSKQAIKTRIEF